MNSVLNWFNNSLWLNIISLIIGILGIFLAYYFYNKSLKEKKPVFLYSTISLFHANPIIAKKIEIKYNGNQVDTLSLTRFAFWNAGIEPIRRIDIAPNSPFLIKTQPEVNILDFEITKQNPDNNFSVQKIDDHTLKIEFDFVDFNDGISINIFHNTAQGHKITIAGTFIGAKKLSIVPDQPKSEVIFDKIAQPVNYFLGKKSFFMKLIAILLMVPTIVVMIVPGIIIGPMDTYKQKKNQAARKKFLYEG